MKEVRFTIDGEPKGKARHRSAIVNGHIKTYNTQDNINYENYVKLCYKAEAQGTYFEGALEAQIYVWYAVPESWSKKKKEAALAFKILPQVKPDVDNIAKVILDSLNGIAYKDDKQVVGLTVLKAYNEKAYVAVRLVEC